MSPSSTLFSVAGKNVLITGGSRGIGLMIAKGFAQSGANVLLTSRDEKACSEAASSIDCRYVVSNVATREGCKALAEEASRIFHGKLDVLVNNVSNMLCVVRGCHGCYLQCSMPILLVGDIDTANSPFPIFLDQLKNTSGWNFLGRTLGTRVWQG
jgi:NAD(P)-dependent dehydrogenase (short-subunit alcohol dehydrogenase family)